MASVKWRIFRMIKLDGDTISFKQFNDGSLRLNLAPRSCYASNYITWLYDSDLEMSYLWFIVKHLRERYEVSRLILEMPYCPHARMDRIKANEEVFTLKYFCDFINSLHFDQVRIFDPHSDVTAALLHNVRVEMPVLELTHIMKWHPDATIFFPDNGAAKKYKYLIGNKHFSFGVKDREWSNQKINSLLVVGAQEDIENHDILIVDDIVSRGSTIYLAASQLKDLGANNIYVYVSHCEDTVLDAHINSNSLLDIPDLITKLYTTNSILRKTHEKIEIIKEFK